MEDLALYLLIFVVGMIAGMFYFALCEDAREKTAKKMSRMAEEWDKLSDQDRGPYPYPRQ